MKKLAGMRNRKKNDALRKNDEKWQGVVAEKDAALADKDAEIAGKDAEIAALRAKLNEGQ